MDDRERERLDRLTEAVHLLLANRWPAAIPCEDDPDDEIRQLAAKINRLLDMVSGSREAIVPLSNGILDIDLPRGNFLTAPFKQLQANLKHLTWQTEQIASGDYGQRVDFMGDFSRSFNSMVASLDEARSQLVAQAQVAEQLAETKTRYLNIMAHDIRTPIGAVIGVADILLDGELNADQRKHVEIIRRNCHSLLSLINNILDFAKLGKKAMELETVRFSLRTLVGDLVEMLRPKCGEGVDLVLDLDPGLPDWVVGDPNRLRQILVNLLGNAAKFTSEGSVTLRIEARGSGNEPIRLRMAASDTGIGIAEEKMEHIFSPFAQAESGIVSRYGGTGLGLSIARELVRLMGGELEVESRVGQGTTFHFTIALSPAEAPPVETGKSKPGAGRVRILVVDEAPDALAAIAHQLRAWPIRFDLCPSSTEAIDVLNGAIDNGDPFALAWLGPSMPELDGLELARRIRMHRRLEKLPVVACTSHIVQDADADAPKFFRLVATQPVPEPVIRQIIDLAGKNDTDAGEAVDLAGIRVLLVEDSPLSRMLIRRILEKRQVILTEAVNGAEGVRAVMEGDFDAVLMDRVMPEMDGLEAIRRIRERYDGERLPVFALTADESDEARDELLAAGANGFFSKPISTEQLLEGRRRSLARRGMGDVQGRPQ